MIAKIYKFSCVIMCVLVLALSLSACAPNNDMTEKNITATVSEVEDALKQFNTKELDKYVSSSTLSVIVGYAEKHDQFKELGKAIFSGLEIEVKSVDVEAQTVTVSVKNKELYAAAAEFADQLKSDYSTFQLLMKLGDEDFLDTKLALLTAKIDEAEMREDAIEVTLNVTQGKKNLVLSFDSAAEDAVSGGALDAIKSIYGK